MIIIVSLLFVIINLYFYYKIDYNYWKRNNVVQCTPIYPFGNYMKFVLLQKSLSEMVVERYNMFPDEKLVGGYRCWCPELVVRDPELIKRILVTDFQHFYPRGIIRTKYIEPVLRNLFFADGDLWKLLRQRLTLAFTSAKLKAMFPLVVERAERLQASALQAATAGRIIDARDLMARYTTDFIGACAFGLDANSLNDEHSAFRKLGAKIFKTTVSEILVMSFKEVSPKIFQNFKYMGKIEKELFELVKTILEKRNYKHSGRNDFIDILLECREKGKVVGESIEKTKSDGSPEIASLQIDDTLIAAQVFVFFAAGFETASAATSFTLHQLAYHQEIQKKIQKEVDQVLERHQNKLCYDAVREMTYLECALKESLRMFPPAGVLFRDCAKKYTFTELNVTIEEGTRIYIPLQSLHNDPKYFQSPDEFQPERFNSVSSDSKRQFIYMPFGEGPRLCIGARLGMLQSMAGLAAILSTFTVKPASTSARRLLLDPRGTIVQTLKHGLPLKFERRTSR